MKKYNCILCLLKNRIRGLPCSSRNKTTHQMSGEHPAESKLFLRIMTLSVRVLVLVLSDRERAFHFCLKSVSEFCRSITCTTILSEYPNTILRPIPYLFYVPPSFFAQYHIACILAHYIKIWHFLLLITLVPPRSIIRAIIIREMLILMRRTASSKSISVGRLSKTWIKID